MALMMARFGCRLQAKSLQLFKNVDLSKFNIGRTLFTLEAIKVSDYVSRRRVVEEQFASIGGKFRDQMKTHISSPGSHLIFTDDLKNFLHFMENTPEDVSLCLQMIERFSKQNKEMRFGTYQFGPIVMRMLHHFKLHDEAFQLITDPEYDGFFDKLSSFVIALDLLYESGKYEDVLKVAEVVAERQLYGCKYPKDVNILVMATLYQQNTKESLDYLMKFLNEARKYESFIPWRALHFAAALALEQKMPDHALEILSSCNPNLPLSKTLMVMSNAELDRTDDALGIIRRELSRDFPRFKQQQFLCEEAILALNAAATRNGNKELIHEVKLIEQQLRDGNFVQKDSLKALLCAPILPPVKREERAYRSSDTWEGDPERQAVGDRRMSHEMRRSQIPRGLNPRDE